MKVLVATERTRGDLGETFVLRSGRLLWITMVGARDHRDPEGGCGCGRGFGGVTSQRATTTDEVVERKFTAEELRLAVRTSLADQAEFRMRCPATERRAVVAEVVAEMRATAGRLLAVTIVRRHVDHVHAYFGARPDGLTGRSQREEVCRNPCG